MSPSSPPAILSAAVVPVARRNLLAEKGRLIMSVAGVAFADRVLWLEDGRIRAGGDPPA